MEDQNEPEGRISFLSVGTKILLKDSMDQFLRTLGDIKTHYAPNLSSALRAYSENTIHVVITEVDLGDASAFRLVQELGGASSEDDLFIVIALEERSDALMAMASELEAHSVLVKPFSAADLKALLEKFKTWKTFPKDPWQLLIREGHIAVREKKYREAERNFQEAIKSAPSNPIPMYKVGLYYMSKPDLAIAEVLFKKAVSIRPDYVQAISMLGTLYLARGELDKAEEHFKKANELSPFNPDRRVEMIRMYISRCIEMCKATLRLDPGNVNARYYLGKLSAHQKDYVGAVRELERVLPSVRDEMKLETQTYLALARKLGGLAK